MFKGQTGSNNNKKIVWIMLRTILLNDFILPTTKRSLKDGIYNFDDCAFNNLSQSLLQSSYFFIELGNKGLTK